MFCVLALMTFIVHARSPLGPGQDFHYHLMVASIHARPAGDAIKTLYHAINPLDANTFLYTLAWPIEKLTNPVRAFQVTTTLFIFIGFPLATAVALRRAGRAPWASLLAFPMIYSPTYVDGGFMPFLSAAPFFVLAIGEFGVAHTAIETKKKRIAIALSALWCVLTFLSHGHVFMWLAILLGSLTILLVLHELVTLPFAPRAALARGARVAATSLALIAPALVAFGRWYMSTHYGQASATSNKTWQALDAPWGEKLTGAIRLLWHTRSDVEAKFTVALALVAFACLLVTAPQRRRGASFVFVYCFVVTLLSIFVLPVDFNGQTVSRRHIDLTVWLLPLVVLDTPALLSLRQKAVVAAVFAFSVLRVEHLGRHLRLLDQDDYRGLLALAEQCKTVVERDGRPRELAYAALGFESQHWHARSLHQAHETLAAVCGLDTPVYSPFRYPNNLLPLRYEEHLPAPITILSRDAQWYSRSVLWDNFDYVLVQGWSVPSADAERLVARGELVARAGDFQLWRRK